MTEFPIFKSLTFRPLPMYCSHRERARKPIDRLLESGAENIEVYPDRSYDLFFKCRYVLSDGSTMTADVRDEANQAIDRIRAIEAGVSVYPRETLSELIEIDGPIAWDIIRRDLGLAANDV